MIEIYSHPSAIGLVPKIIKFTEFMNLSTWTNISLIIPCGTLIDLSPSKRVVEVCFISLRLNCRYTEYRSKLKLAPRSSNACSILWSPIMQETVGQLGSLYFKALSVERMEFTSSVKKVFFAPYIFFLQCGSL